MKKYFDTVQDQAGNAVSGASVTVYNYGTTTKASIYSDSIGTAKSNPVTTDSSGYFEFYASNGRYTLTVTGANTAGKQVADVLVQDINDASYLSSSNAQAQTYTAFTTTGSSGAYVVTASPAVTLTSGTRLRLNFSFSTSGACTLAANGTAATAIKQYNASGSKVDPTIVAGQLADVEFDGTNWVILNPLTPSVTAGITLGTFTALSGTSVDFTGIPSTAKVVRLIINSVSTNGTSNMLVRLGSSSGGIETSGYTGTGSYWGATGAQVTITVGFTEGAVSAANIRTGVYEFFLTNAATNTWTCRAIGCLDDVAYQWGCNGKKSLTSTLDRIRITTAGGTDTFDSGSAVLMYE